MTIHGGIGDGGRGKQRVHVKIVYFYVMFHCFASQMKRIVWYVDTKLQYTMRCGRTHIGISRTIASWQQWLEFNIIIMIEWH